MQAKVCIIFPNVVSVVKFSVGSRCNALEVFVIVFAVGFSCVPILLWPIKRLMNSNNNRELKYY